MMDLSLDHKQSKALSCHTCDPQKMRLRNCNNAYGKSQSPILVNGNVYRQCPRSMVANDWELGHLVSLYFECRENKTTPSGGSVLKTTAFCKSAFEIMDAAVSDYREREAKKQEEEHKKEMAKLKNKKGKK